MTEPGPYIGDLDPAPGQLQEGSEMRVQCRLAWNNWPDSEGSRREIAAHEARDPISAAAWDRVVATITKSAPAVATSHRACEMLPNRETAEAGADAAQSSRSSEPVAPMPSLEQRPIEVWKGDRKVTIYDDIVLRVWGPNMETEMSEEKRTHESVGAAMKWLYASPQPPSAPDALREALTGLTNAADGLAFRENDIRAVVGNTNWHVIRHWIDKARAALVLPQQAPSEGGTSSDGGVESRETRVVGTDQFADPKLRGSSRAHSPNGEAGVAPGPSETTLQSGQKSGSELTPAMLEAAAIEWTRQCHGYPYDGTARSWEKFFGGMFHAAMAAAPSVQSGQMSSVMLTELDDASNACLELAAKHGYATGHGDKVGDMIREFSAQIPYRPSPGGQETYISELEARIDAFGKVTPEQYEKELADLRSQVEKLTAALRAFSVHSTYAVSVEINRRGYEWRGQEALDYAKGVADEALALPSTQSREGK